MNREFAQMRGKRSRIFCFFCKKRLSLKQSEILGNFQRASSGAPKTRVAAIIGDPTKEKRQSKALPFKILAKGT